ncbi:MAG: endolytic transglycosylase MltG [Cyanobacteria bacterium J06597_1]
MGWIRKLVTVGAVSTGILAIAGGVGGWFGWKHVSAPVVSPELDVDPVRVTISPGSSLRDISQQLEHDGVLRSPQALEYWMRFRDLEPKAGTFDFDPRWDLSEIATRLNQGRGVEVRFTIPEGWRITQMANYFEQLGWFSAEDFIAATEFTDLPEFDWLPPDLPQLEGWLFPDTYQIPLDARTPQQVIISMLEQFETSALPVYREYEQTTPDAERMSLVEWVTLGSIVEKESVIAEERFEIAGVFTNRLEQGIPLAADPTVEYAFNITQTPDRRLTYAEVAQPSPYNTYVNAGLPPTAIASPGLASLEATLNPATTENLYFVARYDGSHVFSRTIEEHLAAQRQIIQDRQVN